MKTKIIIFLIIGLLFSGISYAQTVEATSAGAIIINCTSMVSEIYSTIPKKTTTIATDDTQVPSKVTDDLATRSNEKVSSKFEVAPDCEKLADDDKEKGYVANDEYSGRSWKGAILRCHNKGDGWRLPTFKEFVLMAVLQPELAKKGVTFKRKAYWCATEMDHESYYNVSFSTSLLLGFNYKIKYTAKQKKELGISTDDRGEGDEEPNQIHCVRDVK